MTSPADKGFVLVPVEPTQEMIELGMMAYNLTGLPGDAISTAEEHLTLIYEALTSKAPSPVLSGEAGEMVERLNRWHWETTNQWSDEYSPRRSWEKQVSDAMKQWGEASDNAASLISTLVRERDEAREGLSTALANPWCPNVCPITQRPFFMWIDGEPTYGGPFDSYTIPTRDADGEFSCRRYDHDEGGWKDWSEGMSIKIVDESDWLELESRAVDMEALNKELVRHAREAGMSYREDEFGAPYFINTRAEASQREVERLRGILAEFIDHHNEGPGLIDCIDNDGDRYTSQGLADTIDRARAALKEAGNG